MGPDNFYMRLFEPAEERTELDSARVASAEIRGFPAPLSAEPDEEEIIDEMSEGMCTTSCDNGCVTEPDGYCPCGHPAWSLRLGLV